MTEGHLNTPSPVVSRRSERVRTETCCPIELAANVVANIASLVVRMSYFLGEAV